MQTRVKIYISGNKQADFGLDSAWFGGLCLKTLEKAEFDKHNAGEHFELNIALVDDEKIRALNQKHRGKDKATNVLSFPAYDHNDPYPPGADIPLGDIVLSFETILNEASEQDKDFRHHVAHLTIHGVLHLLGYDHENEDDAHVMEALEVFILEEMGIKNPYISG